MHTDCASIAHWLCVFSLPRRVSPHEPLVLLCIAAALLNQAATKKVADRHRAVLQAFAFMQEYGDCRCACMHFSCMILFRWGMGVLQTCCLSAEYGDCRVLCVLIRLLPLQVVRRPS